MGNKITYGDKAGITEKTIHENQFWDTDANEIKDKHNLNDDRITAVEAGQTVAAISYATLALLQASGSETLNVVYKVTNDSTSSNNGYYHWDGAVYVQDDYPETFNDNLLDATTYTTGSYIEADGVVTPNVSLKYSAEIGVTPLAKYAVYNQIRNTLAWYDSSHVFISMSGGEDILLTQFIYEAPYNAAYCRINVVIATEDDYRLSEGSLYIEDLAGLAPPSIYKTEGLNFSIMGDSISTYDSFIPVANDTFYPDDDVTRVDLTWWRIFEKKSRMNLLINESWSGARVTLDPAGVGYAAGKAFTESSRYTNLSDGAVDPDVILVLGGINDWISVGDALPKLGAYPTLGSDKSTWDIKDFKEAYPFLIESLIREYPLARIFFCIPLQMEGQGATTPFSENDSAIPWTRQTMNESIKYLCDQYGVDYIDLAKCGISWYNESTYLIDGVHPNAAGMQLIADYLYGEFITKI